MKTISRIHIELLERTSFRTTTEKQMFNECIELFQERRYYASCTLGMVLFEKIFFSRLHTLTYLPNDFTPTDENVIENLKFYMNREREIINGNDPHKNRGLSFYDVTTELSQFGVITEEEKSDYDRFYKLYRVPVQHGLTLRLYEEVTGKKVFQMSEVNLLSEKTHKIVSEMTIRKIYEISKLGGIWD